MNKIMDSGTRMVTDADMDTDTATGTGMDMGRGMDMVTGTPHGHLSPVWR
jgi:hypothetical protein